MKSTDVIVGGLILILIVASGSFFVQLTEIRHDMELQARTINETLRGTDYVPRKELDSFVKEIDTRMGDLSREIEETRKDANKVPEVAGGASEGLNELRREFETRFTNINNEMTNIRNDINRIGR